MYKLFIAFATVVIVLILILALVEIFADRWAAYVDGARAELDDDYFDNLRALPETTAFDPPADLPRARLRSIPVQRAELAIAAPLPPADDAWLEELLAADPLQVPQQRRAGEQS